MTGYPAWPELFRWLTVLKDRVEQLPSISAEQVITGTFDPSLIPPIPWDRVLKAGSSLGDLEIRSASELSSGTLLAARMPGLAGDVSSVAGSVATTLATVNLTPGTYGGGATIPLVTVNAKGLVTSVTEQPIVLVAGGYVVGDLLYANSTTTLTTLHDVAVGSYLRSGGVATAPLWSTLKLPNAVTAGSVVFASATDTYGQDNANLFWDDVNNRLGVGTKAPSDVGHFKAAADMKIIAETTANIYAGFRWKNPARSWVSQVEFVSTSKWRLVDETAGVVPLSIEGGGVNDALFIKASGNIGIGTSSPATLLDISSAAPSFQMTDTTASAKSLRVVTDANVTNFYEAAGAAGDILTLDLTNKRVGIGLTNPHFKFEVVGDIWINANNGGIAVSGITPQSNRIITGDLLGFGTAGSGVTHFMQRFSSTFRWVSPAGQVLTFNDSNGNLGLLGVTTPTGALHLPAGTATASSAPLKFNSGTVLTTAEAGAIEFNTDDYFATITTGAARKAFVLDDGARLTSGRIPVATTNGRLIDSALRIPVTGRSTAQTAAVATVVTTTLAAADGSVLVSANVNVTTSTLHSFSVQVDYTDETNTAQTLTLSFSQLSAAIVSVITNATGAGPYEGLVAQIRCKASTAITVKTTGTFTTVTYNVEATLRQIS